MVARLTIATEGADATAACGEALASAVARGDVVVLTGDLGAGKTQVTKGLGRGLGVREPVTSPTFNILLVHEGRIPLYHLDLYRLERPEELDDIDYFATLEGDGVSVVEWGDRFAESVPNDGVLVALHITGDTARRLEVEALGRRGAVLTDAWRSAIEGLAGVAVTDVEPS